MNKGGILGSNRSYFLDRATQNHNNHYHSSSMSSVGDHSTPMQGSSGVRSRSLNTPTGASSPDFSNNHGFPRSTDSASNLYHDSTMKLEGSDLQSFNI